jgi:hypothetical protein
VKLICDPKVTSGRVWAWSLNAQDDAAKRTIKKKPNAFQSHQAALLNFGLQLKNWQRIGPEVADQSNAWKYAYVATLPT